jgi:hypothetical protein
LAPILTTFGPELSSLDRCFEPIFTNGTHPQLIITPPITYSYQPTATLEKKTPKLKTEVIEERATRYARTGAI